MAVLRLPLRFSRKFYRPYTRLRAGLSSEAFWEDKLTEETRQLAIDLLNTSDNPWQHRRALSKAITLAESRNPIKQEQAALLLTSMLHQPKALERRRKSFRVGIAGAPGAGKSTFIEAFGMYVLDNNHADSDWSPEKLAVVCVDPSGKTGGSILGDKARMTQLSRHENAFVRPAPAAGALGGLSTYTDDVVALCQVADYDLVMVETVGLGQSEVEVEETVDMLILLVPPGGGDELQGVKKGILEVANLLAVTKADGNLMSAAKRTAADYRGAMQFLRMIGPTTADCQKPDVLLVSSELGNGLGEVWNRVCNYRRHMIETGLLTAKRQSQAHYWMWKNLQNLVKLRTEQDENLTVKAKHLQIQLDSGQLTPRVAAAQLLDFLTH